MHTLGKIYNEKFFDEQKDQSLRSAQIVVPYILSHLNVNSVTDVGCGVGTWLSAFKSNGIENIYGYDSNELDNSAYYIEKNFIRNGVDFTLDNADMFKKSDLVITLEVAEHIPESFADNYLEIITTIAPVVIFSAAIPQQTGVHHVNEQPSWYWRNKFNTLGFIEIDWIRPTIWKQKDIAWWYRQNMTMYIKPKEIINHPKILNIYEFYKQQDTPHNLTLINEWILKSILEERNAIQTSICQESEGNKYFYANNYKNNNLKLLKDRFIECNVPVNDVEIDILDFKTWMNEHKDLEKIYENLKDVRIEKYLEHYLASKWVNLEKDNIYIDVAASGSIWAPTLRQKGVQAYRLDLNYKKGIHGIDIGADAGDTLLPDEFANALSLQCAFETFRKDADVRFIKEAGRILKTGGKLAIIPLYTDPVHYILSSPQADLTDAPLDEGAIRVWREDEYHEAFSRHYSPEAFARRIFSQLGPLQGKILYFTNIDQLKTHYPGQRIYCHFMFFAYKPEEKKSFNASISHSPIQSQKQNISVIIPTRNRANFLDKALRSFLIQSLDSNYFEVIVVDNGSNDDTSAVAKELQHKFKKFQYIYDDNPGLHVGRHAGFRAAQSDLLVFCDDDIIALPTWLEAIQESFQKHPDAALVTGKILPKFEDLPPSWFQELMSHDTYGNHIGWYTILDFGDEIKEIPPSFVWGTNYAIRKDILKTIGGFHPDGMPFDIIKFRGDGETGVSEKISALGLKAIYNPGASVLHQIPKDRLTLTYLYHRAFSQGISDSYTTIRKNGKIGALNKNIVSTIEEVHQIIQKGLIDGYNFHHLEVLKDPQLFEWVMKKSYLE